MRRTFAIAALAGAFFVTGYLVSISRRIERQSTIDEARQADIIVVLGAAEYNGRPSPVLRARLDHALELYRRGLAKMILTSGGAGGDPQYTEGEVGRDYLVKRGVPAEAIVLESDADSTVATVLSVAEIMRRMDLHSAILVSDGYHIFRAKRILQNEGMTVYGAPRPTVVKHNVRERWMYFRQACGYLLWRVGINV
ncbi:MAG: YdcF family protein [Acidobacteria bacterium]|nr:YdcF family protein [Acidobacteriota bacterium]